MSTYLPHTTVWHRGLTLKLLKTIPSRSMVRVIMSMISQRRFHVHMGGKKSRCRTLINGVPQGSVIAPLLFNIYTHDLPNTISKKFVYADDLALKSTHPDFPEIERELSVDVDNRYSISRTGDSRLIREKLSQVYSTWQIVKLTTN